MCFGLMLGRWRAANMLFWGGFNKKKPPKKPPKKQKTETKKARACALHVTRPLAESPFFPGLMLFLVGCLTSQQHASVSQGRICSDNFTFCHTEIEVADQTLHITQSQYTDTGPTSPSTDHITPGARQGSHWSANFSVNGMTPPRKNPVESGIRTQDLPLSRRTP